MLMLFAILLFNWLFQSQSLYATNLYDAVNDSAEYARDDSSRMSRGTFVINVNKFRRRLSEYKIKNLQNKKHDYRIYFLTDTANNNSNNGYGASTAFQKGFDESHPIYDSQDNAKYYSDNGTGRNGNHYVPIKGLQVQVTDENIHQLKKKSLVNPAKANGKFIATFVIQESDTDPKSIKGIDLSKSANGGKSANQPSPLTKKKHGSYRGFFEDQRSAYDLTTPSYKDEDQK